MIFNSLTYAIFFIAVVLLHFTRTAGKTARRQNLLLLAASYFFYGWWDWRFLGLIIFSTALTYACANTTTKRRLWCTIGISANVATLVLFKYFNFFGEGLARLLGGFGWTVDWVTVDILLPVGISFYTFQAIGYLADCSRRRIAPCTSPVDFALFISYFPQLVAGPIERASDMLPRFAATRRWNPARATEGLRLILWGIFKKVAVADAAGIFVDEYWPDGSVTYGPLKLLETAIFFSVQIYCDFSGYCDIALGSSRILGIDLSRNFDRPYFSRSVLEFWHRWHISLMRWFTDYVYIPLGGSRRGTIRTASNIAAVFLLSGLWHGASITFVTWGVYWAIIYILARFLFNAAGYRRYPLPPERSDALRISVTMCFVIIGWIIFRSDDAVLCADHILRLSPILAGACLIAAAIASRHRILRLATYMLLAVGICAAVTILMRGVHNPPITYFFLIPLILTFIAEWRTRAADGGGNPYASPFPLPRHKAARMALYTAIFYFILTAPASDAAFIYFQF